MSGGKENRRVVRINLESPLKVVMGSMGSTVRYDLQTRDVSSNGFFLDFESPGRFPFTRSSIMEVWLEVEEGNTIFFNGKMARVVYSTDEDDSVDGPGIAIRIVQITADNENRLREFITRRIRENEESQKGQPAAS